MRILCGELGRNVARLGALAAVLAAFANGVAAEPSMKSTSADDMLTTQSIGAAPSDALYEVRAGLYATDLEGSGNTDEGSHAFNAELLFGRLDGAFANPVADFVFRPRPHVGGTFNPSGTSEAYAGLTWEHALVDRVFAEVSFGGAVHDGPTGSNNPDSYGCTLLFRESASIGVDLTGELRLIATVDHISNAGLCGENQGLTNAGVRLGYRW